jgi:hypothetical protein
LVTTLTYCTVMYYWVSLASEDVSLVMVRVIRHAWRVAWWWRRERNNITVQKLWEPTFGCSREFPRSDTDGMYSKAKVKINDGVETEIGYRYWIMAYVHTYVPYDI